MKLTDRTDLSPETIALYQRLEKGHHQPKLTKAGKVLAVSFAAMTLWPVVLLRWPLRSGLALFAIVWLIGLDAAHRYPAQAPLPPLAESSINMAEVTKSLVGCPAGTYHVSRSYRASSYCRSY
jgi:hypothetical protein